jgi:choline dehydrogenase-like flavoprotein
VIDSTCRAFGVDNLRVVDLSVVPQVPRANTNLTAIMIGEYMATMLKATN